MERLIKDFQNTDDGLNSFRTPDLPVIASQLGLFVDVSKKLKNIVKVIDQYDGYMLI